MIYSIAPEIACGNTITFSQGGEIIVLRNHGCVARGRNLDEAIETVVAIHLKLIKTANAQDVEN